MDEVDHKILEILSKNSRTPFTEVGKDLGLSDSTIHIRINRLLEEGVIKRFTLEVDRDAFEKKVQSLVLLNVHPGSLEKVANQLIEYEAVDALYEIHGPNDLILKIEASSLEDMRSLILKIREISDVATSGMTTILKVWKEKRFNFH